MDKGFEREIAVYKNKSADAAYKEKDLFCGTINEIFLRNFPKEAFSGNAF